MPERHSNYDLQITIDDTKFGYMLWRDPQTGKRTMGRGLAPLITPQHRINEFSYEHIPPEIDVPAAFETWEGGSGFTEYFGTVQGPLYYLVSLTDNTPTVYNYSRGIDASWPSKLYLSPERIADNASGGGAIAAAPTFFWNSVSFGLWCFAGVYAYKYDTVGQDWVLKKTAAAAIKSVAELNGVMYLSLNGSAYVYSADGTTWTTFSDNTLNSASIADLFVVRDNTLFAMLSEKIYATTNGQHSGTAWSSGVAVGHTSETTQSMVAANGLVWIFKKQAIYTYDGTTVSDFWKSPYIDSSNGAYSYIHSDGKIYVTYASQILSIDPFNTVDSPMAFVYPPDKQNTTAAASVTGSFHDSTELRGTISQITGTITDLYFTITNPAGNTYLMKGHPNAGVFHTLAYLGANANSACLAAPGGALHSANPTILTGYGTAAVHYIIPRSDLLPDQDANCRFDTTQGSLYSPYLAYGARAFDKFLNRGSLLSDTFTVGQSITLNYEIDNNGTITDLVSFVTQPDGSGLTEANVLGSVSFNRIRSIIYMQTPTDTSTPVLNAATLHATLNPPRRQIWKPLIYTGDNVLLKNGTVMDATDSVASVEALFAGSEKRCELKDANGNVFVVRILDIEEQERTLTRIGERETEAVVWLLTLAEISPTNGGF